MSLTATAAPARFHVGLHVSDLARSVRFYSLLLGAGPAKHYDDYAKFEVGRPPLVLALYPSPQAPGGALNHAGLRLPDAAALVEVQRRLEEAGVATQRQDGVACCYALQTKFWVTDPDKVLWEIYTLHEDLDHSGFDDPPRAEEVAPAEKVWQHRLTDALPARIDHPDGSLDEVQLEGTFNAAVEPARLAALLAEAHRALRPGGRVAVHGLVGDRPFPGTPALPGLASLVQRVPVEAEAAEALEAAGFRGLFYDKLGDVHCFQVHGVELREMRLTARKPGGVGARRRVMYKGPFAEVADADGAIYVRGAIVEVAERQADLLRRGPAADQFAFLPG